MTDSHTIGHIKVSTGTKEHFVSQISKDIENGGHTYCVPLNLTKYEMTKSDPKLAEVLNRADYVVADGMSIKMLSRRMGNKTVERVTGIDLSEALLEQARDKKWRLFFLGTKPENLQLAIDAVKTRFNDPIIAGFQDGYFKPEEIDGVIENINASHADILFLGLGLPQKEYFIADHFDQLNVKFCITVGGALDVWAGVKSRAPTWVQKLGIEWFYRSFYGVSRGGLIIKYGLFFLKDLIFPPKPK